MTFKGKKMPRYDWTEEKKNLLRELYPTTTAEELSKLLDIPYTAVSKMANNMGIKKSWKYDYVGTQGYKITGKSRTPERYAEHRKVMENILGRKLESNEIVHHVNGNKLDNRPENLVLTTRSKHIEEHRETIEDAWREKCKSKI